MKSINMSPPIQSNRNVNISIRFKLYDNRKSLKDFQSATRLVLSGDLAKGAIDHGIKSLDNPKELYFQPSFCLQDMKESKLFNNFPKSCGIHLSAMLDYLVTCVLGVSIKVAIQYNTIRLLPVLIKIGISKDRELEDLFNGIIIPSSGGRDEEEDISSEEISSDDDSCGSQDY
ncbi:hypothetical protein DFA_09043 [Cavenderia fasciculata]|uniref:Uncharacterized protein n=1 Tax=Cavenderia fasciculata TaxID=261658 RepID=F4Q6J5_CACFS|nr:uncharacterized protein DFA_09043 [Cavenderia fasciculata]EGG16505.1 hypothetical protein DFA_09043 [Cavenderia fasciculata]|eukprot:XP_004354905.1 hypothetical protein DFA_09043 [Cavenderia fasciculata]